MEQFRAGGESFRAHTYTRTHAYIIVEKKRKKREKRRRKEKKRMSLSVLRIACVISDVIYDYHHAIVGQLVHLLLNYSDVT